MPLLLFSASQLVLFQVFVLSPFVLSPFLLPALAAPSSPFLPVPFCPLLLASYALFLSTYVPSLAFLFLFVVLAQKVFARKPPIPNVLARVFRVRGSLFLFALIPFSYFALRY